MDCRREIRAWPAALLVLAALLCVPLLRLVFEPAPPAGALPQQVIRRTPCQTGPLPGEYRTAVFPDPKEVFAELRGELRIERPGTVRDREEVLHDVEPDPLPQHVSEDAVAPAVEVPACVIEAALAPMRCFHVPVTLSHDRYERLRRLGGSCETAVAVNEALRWMCRRRSVDGGWPGGEAGKPDLRATGLALVAFLAEEHTARTGWYRREVSAGLGRLIGRQGGDDRIGEGAAHGISTLCLSLVARDCEQRSRDAARQAVALTLNSQAENSGWAAAPGAPPDIETTLWHVLALAHARRAGLGFPQRSRQGAWQLLNDLEVGDGCFRRSSRAGRPDPESTAMGLFCRILLGAPRDSREVTRGLKALIASLPKTREEMKARSPAYWAFGSCAAFRCGGPEWPQWNSIMKTAVLDGQRSGASRGGPPGDPNGSWDPWDGEGRKRSRLEATVLNSIALGVYRSNIHLTWRLLNGRLVRF
ncbi:MAG: hypothetical protein ACYTGB_01400 [Planctomycetota bacterium]|jgi:hypothetical protein